MRENSPIVRFFSWGLLFGVLATVVAIFFVTRPKRSTLPELSHIEPFVLTNQLGEAVSARDLSGKVWVGDIIFSRCAGPCPKMTEEMSKLQAAFNPSQPLRFVTLTTDPDYDTPAVLKHYSEKFNADPKRWQFLTGPKSEIRNVAAGSLKLAAVEKEKGDQQTENDLFIHSTIFVLIDKFGVMRGVYESLEPGFQEKIRADIQSLLNER